MKGEHTALEMHQILKDKTHLNYNFEKNKILADVRYLDEFKEKKN